MKSATAPRTDDADLRHADALTLATALLAGRAALLQLLQAYRQALGPELRVAMSPELNLPLWELGHIGWFEDYWIGRNPHRSQGVQVDVAALDALRTGASLPGADQLYDSTRIVHVTRWALPLPNAAQTLAYLDRVRETTLGLLDVAEPSDSGLYFFRLVLFHEAMHREAWIYMAQTQGIALSNTGPGPQALAANEARVAGGEWALGSVAPGFAFDNELGVHRIELAPYRIDQAVVTWRQYLPFVESGAYEQAGLWTSSGWNWRQRQAQAYPRYLRRAANGWQRQSFGQWQPLDLNLPAMNLTRHEAEAWCCWAGRRLPSEAEWELAACTLPSADFAWGAVWEWTASPFAPYPGFVAHPYREYSAPWFDGRPVLRGASFATDVAIKNPRYRNFFPAERNDIFAGFRSCGLSANGHEGFGVTRLA